MCILVCEKHSVFFFLTDTKRSCSDGPKKNGGCEVHCVQLSVGYKCGCPDGTKLADNDYSCEGNLGVISKEEIDNKIKKIKERKKIFVAYFLKIQNGVNSFMFIINSSFCNYFF